MEAAGGGHVEVTQILLDHGAGTSNPSKDSKSLSFDFFFSHLSNLFRKWKQNR